MGHPGLPPDTVPIRLTAQQVRETAFTAVRFGGLNSEQVTRFMIRVTAELEALADENAQLDEENAQLREAASLNGGQSNDQQAVYVLLRAQEAADSQVADARQLARNIADDARQQRERVLADGRNKAGQLIAHALDEAGRQAAVIAARAPIDAQRQLAYWQSLADATRDGLYATLQTLTAQVRAWEEKQRQGGVARPAGPPSGPHPAMPPPG